MYLKIYLVVCSYRSKNAIQSESTLYSCLNVRDHLAQNRRYIRSLSDYNQNWTHNHLARKQTLNHLTTLAKWLSCVLRTYLYGAFDCMFLSCHIRVLECIYILKLLECQGSPGSKQALCLKFKWLQLNHLASLAKWLSVRLRTKRLWVRFLLRCIWCFKGGWICLLQIFMMSSLKLPASKKGNWKLQFPMCRCVGWCSCSYQLKTEI